MNVQSDDVRNIWVEGPLYWGDNTFMELFTQIEISQLICKQICQFMSSVYSLSTTVEITFILPKLYLKKSIKKQLNFSNSNFSSFFFSLIIWESTFLFYAFYSLSQKYLMQMFYYLLLLVSTYHWLIIPKNTS